MAFAEQFIYLCLRHLTVLLGSAGSALRKQNKQNKRARDDNGRLAGDRSNIRTPRLSKDNFYADRISGGVSVSAVRRMAVELDYVVERAAESRSVPFVGGAHA